MRLAHVIPYRLSAYSGVFTSIRHLVRGLAAAGHDMEVWHFGPAWDDDVEELLDELRESATLIEIPNRNRWWLGTAASRLVRSRRIEAVHFHNVFSPLNNITARCITVPYVLSPHGGYAPMVLSRNRIRKVLARHLLELRTVKRASLLHALTELEHNHIRGFGYSGKICIIPNGVDSVAQSYGTPALRRVPLNIPVTAKLAVFVGRLDDYYKRTEDLIRCFSRSSDWHLVLVGPSWQGSESRLRDLFRKLRVEHRIHLLGPRRGDDLRNVLQAGDIFVLMSRTEGHPLALLEALAHGMPAVVSAEVEAVLPVAGHDAGWQTDIESLPEILGQIRLLSESDWEVKRRAAKALAGRFTWRTTVRRLERAIGSVVGQ